MSIGDLINSRRKELGLTLEDVAKSVGVGKSTVRKWEQGMIKNMRRDKIAALASALGLDPVQLVASESPSNNVIPFAPKPKTVRQSDAWAQPLVSAYKSASAHTQTSVCKLLDMPRVVPDLLSEDDYEKMIEMLVFVYPAAMGNPLYAESDFERLSFPESDVPSAADFGIRVVGDSMAPTIEDGGIVWVRKQPDLRDGEVGIFMLGDSAVCKRARITSSGRLLRLESDNPDYDPITGEDLMDARCVGKVLL